MNTIGSPRPALWNKLPTGWRKRTKTKTQRSRRSVFQRVVQSIAERAAKQPGLDSVATNYALNLKVQSDRETPYIKEHFACT